MQVWGVTGLIGAGKSTAVEYIKSKGYPVVDADQVSRLVVDRNTELGKEGFSKVYRAFGPSVLNNLGDLDRRALRKRMMVHPEDRDTLEKILHPLILAYIQTLMKEWKEKDIPLGFVEGSRLIESGFHNVLGGIVLVSAPEDLRVKRVIKRDSMGKDEVAMLIQLQDGGVMQRMCKKEWKNDKTLPNLYKQVDAFIEERLKSL